MKVDGKLEYYGILKSNKKESFERIEDMYLQIQSFIKTNKPDYIVFENTTFSSNIEVLKSLSFLAGCIFSLCIDLDIGCQILFPTQWRKAFNFTGKKRELQKQQAINRVNELYNLDLVYDASDKNGHDDQAEAICIIDAFESLNNSIDIL